jgi:hypothetical protein
VRHEYISEMVQPQHIIELLSDEFGNYVLQCALKSEISPEMHEELTDALKCHLQEIQQKPWGLQIISKICG